MESNYEIETAVEGCSRCGLPVTYVTARHKERGELIRAIARWCGCPLEELLRDVWSDSLASALLCKAAEARALTASAEVHAKPPKGRTV